MPLTCRRIGHVILQKTPPYFVSCSKQFPQIRTLKEPHGGDGGARRRRGDGELCGRSIGVDCAQGAEGRCTRGRRRACELALSPPQQRRSYGRATHRYEAWRQRALRPLLRPRQSRSRRRNSCQCLGSKRARPPSMVCTNLSLPVVIVSQFNTTFPRDLARGTRIA